MQVVSRKVSQMCQLPMVLAPHSTKNDTETKGARCLCHEIWESPSLRSQFQTQLTGFMFCNSFLMRQGLPGEIALNFSQAILSCSGRILRHYAKTQIGCGSSHCLWGCQGTRAQLFPHVYLLHSRYLVFKNFKPFNFYFY